MRHKQREKKILLFLFCLLPPQRNSDEDSATAGIITLPLVNADLHIIPKTFTLTYPSINKSKYKTHPKYIVIVERFQKECNIMECKYNANVITQ